MSLNHPIFSFKVVDNSADLVASALKLWHGVGRFVLIQRVKFQPALPGGLLDDLHPLAPVELFIQLLAQADAYCLPTEYAEGFPTTLLEAAACRCPIVTTRTAGTDELLPGDDYAVFLANAAPETIRAGLETLLAAPAAARTRAENARQNLCSHFTWQAVFATMMEAVTSAKRS